MRLWRQRVHVSEPGVKGWGPFNICWCTVKGMRGSFSSSGCWKSWWRSYRKGAPVPNTSTRTFKERGCASRTDGNHLGEKASHKTVCARVFCECRPLIGNGTECTELEQWGEDCSRPPAEELLQYCTEDTGRWWVQKPDQEERKGEIGIWVCIRLEVVTRRPTKEKKKKERKDTSLLTQNSYSGTRRYSEHSKWHGSNMTAHTIHVK